jgi:ABC-type multidrug transport system ATPase subunit
MAARYASDFERLDLMGQNPGVEACNLTKVWPVPGGFKTAVNDVSMQMPVGAVTVLLGTNGAGKSTALNMMTGLVNPTSGTVIVNGYDIIKNTKQARKNVGYDRTLLTCPRFQLAHVWPR